MKEVDEAVLWVWEIGVGKSCGSKSDKDENGAERKG